MNPTLLVLAAGMGSRYGGLKQMAPMGPSGETILDYSVFDAVRAGFKQVVFVIRPDFADEFKKGVSSRFADKITVGHAYQELSDLPPGFRTPEGRVKPWGTGHAVLAAKNVVDTNFCVINADDFYGRNSYLQMANFLTTLNKEQEGEIIGGLIGYRLRQTLSQHGNVSRGICSANPDGTLSSVREFTHIHETASGAENRPPGEALQKLTGDEIVSLNCWGFTPAFFGAMEDLFNDFLSTHGNHLTAEFYLPYAVDSVIRSKQGAIRIMNTTSPWFGVTYKEDRQIVQSSLLRLIESGEYPRSLFA